jgi:hypothetical protein
MRLSVALPKGQADYLKVRPMTGLVQILKDVTFATPPPKGFGRRAKLARSAPGCRNAAPTEGGLCTKYSNHSARSSQ